MTIYDCEGVLVWALDGGICAGVIGSNRRGVLEVDSEASLMKRTSISWSSSLTCYCGGSSSIMS